MKRIDYFLVLLVAFFIMQPLAGCQVFEAQPTQEGVLPTAQATPPTIDLVNVTLNNIHLEVAASGLAPTFPAGCTGEEPACYRAKEGMTLLGIQFIPSDLPQGDMLNYKELPEEIAVRDSTGAEAGVSYRTYDVTTRILTLAFEVSKSAGTFTLVWPGTNPIPIQPVKQSN